MEISAALDYIRTQHHAVLSTLKATERRSCHR